MNLNYTLTSSVINACLAQCAIRHVLTSRRMLDRFPLKLDAELVFVDELKPRITWSDKLLAAASAWLLPAAAVERLLGLAAVRPDDVATVMFTSGSTGLPKGVMLTHANIGANFSGFDNLLHLRPSDAMLGVLPMFHSFWLYGRALDGFDARCQGIHHHSPLEPRQIGRACQQARRHDPDCHAHVSPVLSAALRARRFAIAGCRHCRRRAASAANLAAAFQEQFGVLPVEGYGATELSPVVSANRPPARQPSPGECGNRLGTVGQPLAGVDVKVIDVTTRARICPAAGRACFWFAARAS